MLANLSSASRHLFSKQFKKKAVGFNSSAFFVFAIFSFFASQLSADCSMPTAAYPVKVKSVLDGDTLKLDNGKKVRLLGVNTPELNYNDGQTSAEFLAKEAKLALALFVKNGGVVYLSTDKEKKDKYQRLLAHVWNEKGENAEMYLLRQGLATQVVFPPNLQLIDCLRAAEQLARDNRLGIWQDTIVSLSKLQYLGTGYGLYTGIVSKVEESKSHWWVEFDGPLVLKISKKKAAGFSSEQLQSWVGRQFLVRGWVIARDKTVIQKGYKPYMMQLLHSFMIEPIQVKEKSSS